MRGFVFLPAVMGALVLILGLSRTTQAAFVELSPSTTLHSHAAAGFTGQAGLIEPQDENDDFADLSDPDVSSEASASLPLPDQQTPADASAAASARINTLADDEFSLTGEASAGVIGAPAPPPLVAHVEAVAQIAVPFTVAAGGGAQLDYDVDIEGMVLNNEKVTIELAPAGAAEFIFREVFTDDASGTLGFLQPGDYNLLLITGAEATNQGVANEQGTAAFAVTLAGVETLAVIPLPAAFAPGAAMLASLWAGLWARRRLRG